MAKRKPGGNRGSRPPVRRVREQPPATRYLESSAILAALLEQEPSALNALRVPGRPTTSALTFAECARAVIRARLTDRLSSAQERDALRALLTLSRRCTVVAVTDTILQRAGRDFPAEPVRTLDAIHLATIDLLGEAPPLVTVVSRDSRVRTNALALGYVVE